MPTYAFTTARELTPAQREKLVESVTAIHQVEATAPRYFVQVVFYKVEPGSIFIGGEVASPDHVWVRADIRSGRTNDQKARMLRRIMRETSEILGISEQDVWVYISDIPAQGSSSSATFCRSQAVRSSGSRRCPAPCARSSFERPDGQGRATLTPACAARSRVRRFSGEHDPRQTDRIRQFAHRLRDLKRRSVRLIHWSTGEFAGVGKRGSNGERVSIIVNIPDPIRLQPRPKNSVCPTYLRNEAGIESSTNRERRRKRRAISRHRLAAQNRTFGFTPVSAL